MLRPLLDPNPWVRSEYRTPAQYDPQQAADIVILDRFRPSAPPRAHTIWIEPPLEGGPTAVRQILEQHAPIRWRTDHPVAAGIRTRDLRLERATVLAAGQGDTPVAEVEAGPVALARAGQWKTVVLGFHPAASAMRYELAAPLLFANILRWMTPDAFLRWEAHGLSAGSVTIELPEESLADVRVLSADGRSVPFTREQRRLRVFSPEPELVRVLTATGEQVYSMTLPQVGEREWQPTAGARRGLPSAAAPQPGPLALWPWLAVAGGIGLLAEWLLYGGGRLSVTRPSRLQRRLDVWRRLARSHSPGGAR